MSLAPRLIVITGGTKGGIGFEAARQLLQQGHRVICTFRDAGKAQVAMDELRGEQSKSELPAEERVQWVKMDLSSFASVKEASAELIKATNGKIDGLLCNAALAPMGAPKPYATVDGFEATYQTNHLSHFLMVHLLLPSLAASTAPGGGRIGVVTSELHKSLGKTPAEPDFLETILQKGNTQFRRLEVYSLSKLFNLWFTFKLAKLLEEAKIPVTVDAVTPGWVPSSNLGHGNGISWIQTFLMQKLLPLMPGTVSMKGAADRLVQVMVGKEAMLEDGKFGSGRYFSNHKSNPGGPEARNTAKADKLWELSLKATGIAADAFLAK